MKSCRILMCALLGGFAVNSAMANDEDFKRFYVGAEYGSAEHKYSNEDYSGDLKDSDKMNGFYVGFRFNENLSIKLGYVDQGSTELDSMSDVYYVDNGRGGTIAVYTDSKLKSDVDGISLGLTYGGEIANGFGGGFDFGIWKYTTDVYVDVVGYEPISGETASETGTLDKKDGVGIYAGMNASYQFTSAFGAELGIKRYVAENDFIDSSDVYLTNIYLGAQFRF